ncbi:MAG TPA: hypothetical protein VFU05_04510 [Cyclobacteriaceae bacterium]|nr:hypothetical protein [Cyclobacteriaceae bacterium]
MKLKNVILTCLLMMFTIVPGYSSVSTNPDVKRIPAPAETPGALRAQELIKRLEEIKAMDVRAMSKEEKRELRAEVKSIKREMRHIHDGGIYISVGGLIVILLLLIILL